MRFLIKYKWVAIILALIFVFIVDAMVFNVSIINRGVAIGLGIDMDGDEIELTAQIVLPKNGGVSSGGNNFINYSAKAKDMEKTIDLISAQSGLELSISHATVIIIGKSVFEKKRFDLFDFFLSDDKVNDNILLVMAEDNAKDILKAKVPVGGVSSYQLSNQLRPEKAPIGLITVTLKDFAMRLHTGNGDNYLPIVSLKPIDPSTDQSKDDQKEAHCFGLNKTAIVNKDGYKGTLDIQLTEGLSIAKMTLQDGVLQMTGSDNRDISIHIVNSKASIKYDYEKHVYKIKMTMITSRSEGRHESNSSYRYDMDSEEMEDFRVLVTERVQAVIDYSIAIGVDVLSIKEGFYRVNPKHKDKIMTDEFLSSIKLDMDIKILQR